MSMAKHPRTAWSERLLRRPPKTNEVDEDILSSFCPELASVLVRSQHLQISTLPKAADEKRRSRKNFKVLQLLRLTRHPTIARATTAYPSRLANRETRRHLLCHLLLSEPSLRHLFRVVGGLREIACTTRLTHHITDIPYCVVFISVSNTELIRRRSTTNNGMWFGWSKLQCGLAIESFYVSIGLWYSSVMNSRSGEQMIERE